MRPDANESGLTAAGGPENRAARPRFNPTLSLSVLILLLISTVALAQQRFPPPDFESGHKLPLTTTPAGRAFIYEYVDVAVLAACIAISVFLIYRKRSRAGLVGLSLFSLAYFGFYRKGCVCAIGSVQNIALALFEPGYAVPVSVLAFFILPLAVSLFFGRSFCAGVCPHGALQDLVLLKPIKVPAWLEQALSTLPFIYLGAGVLLAGTGSAFLICQYDPFVPVFRLSGRALMVIAGVALLALGMFVGRPYCRFLCPYGALLKAGAMVSRWRVTVTPDNCTQCRLCETSCPFGALREPEEVQTTPSVLRQDRRRLAFLIALLPVLVLGCAWVGDFFSGAAAALNPTVSLADRLAAEKETPAKSGALSPDDLALDRARQNADEFLRNAEAIRKRITTGSRIFGGWVGLVIGLKLVGLSVHRRRKDYEPTPGDCLACARCFEFCPSELVRRGFPNGFASQPLDGSPLEPALK
ncbi:MAG TPA: 4Fe-4S binding protein [Verrucomicrobiae bacterium]|nr:4Fe-4S binding protein [Verrucomicrobiae bacterium]